jgi:FkbM family methyltransferase
MIRSIIERFSRGKSIKRRLPAEFRYTPLYVSPDAQLKYLKIGVEAFDVELLRIAREHIREDSHVWDVGSNVGVFAFAAASIARKGSTLAIEADNWLAQLIRKSSSLKENTGMNIQVLNSAISDKNGVSTFLIANRGRASNCLETAGGRSQTGGIRERIIVPTVTLDTILEFFSPPNFLKIDVEGAEAMVLKGAGRLLREIHPTIYIEVGRETNDEVTAILKNNRYVLFDGSKSIQDQMPLCSCTFNTLAISKE